MRTKGAAFIVAVLTVIHGCLVVAFMLSLPVILLYPATRPFYVLGICILLLSWTLFADCPLTTLEKRVRGYLQWPPLNGDFFSHYFSRLTGLQFSKSTHRIVERVYLILVVAIIAVR